MVAVVWVAAERQGLGQPGRRVGWTRWSGLWLVPKGGDTAGYTEECLLASQCWEFSDHRVCTRAMAVPGSGQILDGI